MKKNIFIAFLTASVLFSSSIPANTCADADNAAEDYHTVTFLDYDGQELSSLKVKPGENIDYSLIDTDSDPRLNRHLDIYTEQAFSSWNMTPETTDKDITIKALSKTAVISKEQLPDKTLYFSKNGNISLDGLKVIITMTTQVPTGNDGGFTEETFTVDISSSCTAVPATLDEAFKEGGSSEIEIFPVGQNKAIASYNIEFFDGFGDVNRDNVVDAVDATMVLRAYTLIISDSDYVVPNDIKQFGDINFDGVIDGVDATLLLRYYTLVISNSGITLDEFLDMHDIKPVMP